MVESSVTAGEVKVRVSKRKSEFPGKFCCDSVKVNNLQEVVRNFRNLNFRKLSSGMYLLTLVVNSTCLSAGEKELLQELNMPLREVFQSRCSKRGGRLRHVRTSKLTG